MLTEVLFMEKSLLGVAGLGPNSTKPFWGQGLNLLGTGTCVGPLHASAALSWAWGPSSGQGCANNPVQNQVP